MIVLPHHLAFFLQGEPIAETGGPVLDLGNIVKKAVQQQNMLAWQYNTIGVSDGITMGGEGEYRR